MSKTPKPSRPSRNAPSPPSGERAGVRGNGKRAPLTPASAPFMVADLARRWRCAEQHIIDLIDEGRLRALNIGGRNPSGRRFWRIPAEAVIAFEQAAGSLNLDGLAPKPRSPA